MTSSWRTAYEGLAQRLVVRGEKVDKRGQLLRERLELSEEALPLGSARALQLVDRHALVREESSTPLAGHTRVGKVACDGGDTVLDGAQPAPLRRPDQRPCLRVERPGQSCLSVEARRNRSTEPEGRTPPSAGRLPALVASGLYRSCETGL